MKQQDYYEIAAELGIPNESIEGVKIIDRCVFFKSKNQFYSASLTPTGRFKKHSTRIDRA